MMTEEGREDERVAMDTVDIDLVTMETGDFVTMETGDLVAMATGDRVAMETGDRVVLEPGEEEESRVKERGGDVKRR